jgi:hypothetical protein
MSSALVIQTDDFQELFYCLHCFFGDRSIKELSKVLSGLNIHALLVAFQLLAENFLS